MFEDNRAEMRRLIAAVTDGDTEDAERERAERRLKEISSAWRGFPGQRRRGEPPAGVCVRGA